MSYETYADFKVGDAVVFKEGCDFIRCFIESIGYEDHLKVFHLKDISNGEIFRVSVGRTDYAYCPWRFLEGAELESFIRDTL